MIDLTVLSHLGPPGRSKDIGLYYCFLLWEGKTTRWSTRSLPAGIGMSSAVVVAGTPAAAGRGDGTASSSGDTGSSTKKQKLSEYERRVISNMDKQTEAMQEKNEDEKRVIDAKIDAMKGKNLLDLINSAAFTTQLTPEEQQRVYNEYFKTIGVSITKTSL